MQKEAEQLAQPVEFDALPRLSDSYATIRRYAPAWIEALPLKAAPASRELMAGVELLRDLNRRGARKIPDTAPLGFVRKRWRALVVTPEGIDRRFYELCLLSEIKNALRAGDLWVSGSRTFKEFEEYLLPVVQFEQLQEQHALPLGAQSDATKYLHARLEQLHTQLRYVEQLATTGTLPDAHLEESGLKFTALTNAVPQVAGTLMRRVSALLPRIKITELLLEVESWTGFAGHFTYLGNGQSASSPSLVAGRDPLRWVESGAGQNGTGHARNQCHSAILAVRLVYPRRTYKAASSVLVDAQSQQPLSLV